MSGEEISTEKKCCVRQEAIDTLNEKLNELYIYRDHYFERHSLDKAGQKNDDVENEMKNTLNCFESLKESAEQENRTMYLYLKGRALNVMPQHSKEAEEVLSRAVKLDPKLVEAWNELGECYWKKDNFEEAKNCFSGALLHARNKVSLRNLSMILRQEKVASAQQRSDNIEKGVAYAKEAVQLDPNDGTSWAVLGNAYLSSFFTLSQNPQVLKSCISAYQQAEKDIVARSNPDLHYNKAIALKYEEEYELALESFSRAQALDPTWEAPKQKEKQLVKYLDSVQELLSLKGKLKGKKLQQMVQSIEPRQLGPYGGGSYTTRNETVQLEPIILKKLHSGINLEKVVLGKVVCSVHNDDAVPFTFCLVDKEETCMAVTVYNLAQGKGVIIGDSVAIPEPYLTEVHFKYKQKIKSTAARSRHDQIQNVTVFQSRGPIVSTLFFYWFFSVTFISELFGFPLQVTFHHCYIFTHVSCGGWTMGLLKAQFHRDIVSPTATVPRSYSQDLLLRKFD
ncbi:tetratricopeptide repeat protein 5-like isoform X2 [Zootermopsis nevadensis]|uniref:tetratricopeptide repeat protein 5-like isoform X2 n=1 Tax=Zootermopsis nevadensis TaxID=136037 RepID=UPI000B8E5448|nr:tetratricopeptide repeat protein 5-like isoform X2 [Zootermopsis nevadensis]